MKIIFSYKILILVTLVLVQVSFARLTEKDSLILIDQLDTFFTDLKTGHYKGKQELVQARLTEESVEWFEEIVDAVSFEDSLSITQRPFFEVISILGLRYYYKEHIIEDLEVNKVFKFYMNRGYMQRVFRLTDLGPFWIEKEYLGFIGLKKAPNVPIVFFILENDVWRLDLITTLEVISRSVVNLGIKKGWSTTGTALEILDKIILKDVIDEELLHP